MPRKLSPPGHARGPSRASPALLVLGGPEAGPTAAPPSPGTVWKPGWAGTGPPALPRAAGPSRCRGTSLPAGLSCPDSAPGRGGVMVAPALCGRTHMDLLTPSRQTRARRRAQSPHPPAARLHGSGAWAAPARGTPLSCAGRGDGKDEAAAGPCGLCISYTRRGSSVQGAGQPGSQQHDTGVGRGGAAGRPAPGRARRLSAARGGRPAPARAPRGTGCRWAPGPGAAGRLAAPGSPWRAARAGRWRGSSGRGSAAPPALRGHEAISTAPHRLAAPGLHPPPLPRAPPTFQVVRAPVQVFGGHGPGAGEPRGHLQQQLCLRVAGAALLQAGTPEPRDQQASVPSLPSPSARPAVAAPSLPALVPCAVGTPPTLHVPCGWHKVSSSLLLPLPPPLLTSLPRWEEDAEA